MSVFLISPLLNPEEAIAIVYFCPITIKFFFLLHGIQDKLAFLPLPLSFPRNLPVKGICSLHFGGNFH